MAKAPLTPKQMRQQSTDALFGKIQYGMDHGGPMGAMMGFMDLPFLTRPGATHGNIGGPLTKIWPGGVDPNMVGGGIGGNGGNGGGGNDPTTGGDGPAVDPSKLGALGKSKGFPQWYIDWYNEDGKYGGVPQVSGLLNG